MKDQEQLSPPKEWTQTKPYTTILLLAAIATIIGTVYVLLPGSRSTRDSRTTQERPAASPASPAANPSASTAPNRRDVCGVWLSETSRKQYNFVCTPQGSFEMYEISDQGQSDVGSGKVAGDGNLDADFHVLTKNRWVHLKLRLSEDGRKMVGSFRGSDPREAGGLTFHKV